MYESADRRILEVFRDLERVSFITTSFIKQEHGQHSESAELEYPKGFVTIPDAEYILGSARANMQADFLAYLPSISTQLESEYWTDYSRDNIGWLVESTEVYRNGQEDVPERKLILTAPSNSSEIHNDENLDEDNFVDPDSLAVHYEIWRYEVYDDKGLPIDYDSLACPMWSNNDGNMDTYEVDAFQTAAAIEADRIIPFFPEPDIAEGSTLAPVWTCSPPFHPQKPSIVNFNAQSDPTFHHTTQLVDVSRTTTFDDVCSPTAPWMDPSMFPADRYAIVTTPLFQNNTVLHDADDEILGYYMALVPWTVFFSDIIGDGDHPVTVAVSNNCGRSFTMLAQNGKDATLLNHTSDGQTDREDFNDMKLELPLAPFAYPESGESSQCAFTVSIYPTTTMEDAYRTNVPIFSAMVVLLCFAFTSFAFIAFDCMQQRKQRHLVNTARRQNLLVSALFPKKIQNQLLEEMKQTETQNKSQNKSGTAGLRQFLEGENQPKNNGDGASWASMDGDNEQTPTKKVKPIADLFPETTIMFADIVGKCHACFNIPFSNLLELTLQLLSIQDSLHGLLRESPPKCSSCWKASIESLIGLPKEGEFSRLKLSETAMLLFVVCQILGRSMLLLWPNLLQIAWLPCHILYRSWNGSWALTQVT